MKPKTQTLGAMLLLFFVVSSCCSLQPKIPDAVDTPTNPVKKNTMETKKNTDFENLLGLLTTEGDFDGPFKKSPFMKDHEFVKGDTRIEISSYNTTFKIFTNERDRPKVGQYDLITNKVNRFIKSLYNNEIATSETTYKPDFMLLEVGSKRVANTAMNIDDFPIKSDLNHPPEMTKAHAERLKELILNVTRINELYELNVTSGTSGLFTPSVAMRFSKGQDVVIDLGIPTVLFYDHGEAYQGVKMNPSAAEFKELKIIIKTYYPTNNFNN